MSNLFRSSPLLYNEDAEQGDLFHWAYTGLVVGDADVAFEVQLYI